MEFVPMIIISLIIALVVIIYPRQNTFVDKVQFKSKFFEFEISTKQKNDLPPLSNRSNRKK